MIDDDLKHMLREEEPEHDFAAIAKAATAKPSAEALAILNRHEPDFSDFHEMMTCLHFDLPLPASSTSSSFLKSSTSASLAKRYIETHTVESGAARHALACHTYYTKHAGEAGVTLSERLQGLVARALTLLSAEDGELLEKAARALDMHLVAFFLEKAFVGVEV